MIGAFNAAGCYLLGWLGGKYPKHVLLGIVYILRSATIVVYFMLPATPATTLLFASCGVEPDTTQVMLPFRRRRPPTRPART